MDPIKPYKLIINFIWRRLEALWAVDEEFDGCAGLVYGVSTLQTIDHDLS